MYFNDVHILIYIAFAIIGAIVGFFIGWCNERLPKYEKIFSKEIIHKYKTTLKPNYILMIINAIIYIVLLYIFGLHENITNNINLIKYMVLLPMLLSVFVIDYKLQIIPNRLNLTMFEIGLIFAFLNGMTQNMFFVTDALLGMLAGGGIFLLLTLIGGLIAGKEAMGFGDVKFMGALGLFFGLTNIIVISILSFLIAAIVSIALMIIKKKKKSDYIPFGPFIVLSAFVVTFIPSHILLFILGKILTLGML